MKKMGRLLELNPILTRESRALWRKKAFLLLFGGVSIFALIMFYCYGSATSSWQYENYQQYQNASSPQPLDQLSFLGAMLFKQMCYFQIVGWMLVAPMLTATTLAGERERGLLEALQLSQLSPGAIVRGKLYTALTFATLLLFSLLPVMAICFLLGGVSPTEFTSAAIQTVVAIFMGASIGLWVSARSRRAAKAVGGTFSAVFLWGVGTLFCFGLIQFPWPPSPWHEILGFFPLLNPGITLIYQLEQMPGNSPFLDLPFESWQLGCFLQLLLSFFLLWRCAVVVRRPLDEEYWVELGLGTHIEDFSTAQAKREIRKGKIRQPLVPRDRWELPITHYIRLQNPIMQRDLRARFIFRRVKTWQLFFISLLMLLFSGLYSWIMWRAYTEPYEGDSKFPLLSGICAMLLVLLPAISAASAFTREREAGTWEGIHLSLLAPVDIIMGKQIGAMAPVMWWSLLLLPFFYPALKKTQGVYTQGYQWYQIALVFVFLFSLSWFSAAWGLKISWSARKTATATAWTLGSLFIAFAVLPIFLIWFVEEVLNERAMMDLLVPLHPFGTLAKIFDNYSNNGSALGEAFLGIGFFFGTGCLLLANVWTQMSRQFGRNGDF